MRKTGIFMLLVVFLAVPVAAFASGNAKKGQRIFNRCKPCHSLVKGQRRIGPSLHGLFGRTSGTLPGFNYSSAMKKAHIVWNAKTLDKYLTKPRKVVPGTRMAFPGLPKEEEREDLIAYLKEATKAN